MRPPGPFADDDVSPPSIWDGDADAVSAPTAGNANARPDFDDDHGAETDDTAWRQAEARLGRALVDAASAFARVDERLRALPPSRRRAAAGRLAITAATELLRREGELIGPERLARGMLDREGMGAEDAPSLGRALWAAQRLTAPPAPRAASAAPEAPEEPEIEIDGPLHRDHPIRSLVVRWRVGMQAVGDLHPFTRAAFGRAKWSALGLSAAGLVVERDVAAMRAAAAAGLGGAGFAPMARGGYSQDRARGGSGGAERRLSAWLATLRDGAAAALATIDALAAWRAGAEAAIADLSGKTAPRLIAALTENPAVDAPTAARAAGISTSAAVRNFAILQARGVAREITGQGRFRVWTAALEPGR